MGFRLKKPSRVINLGCNFQLSELLALEKDLASRNPDHAWKIGPVRLLKQIHAGGMGIIYKAEMDGRIVAVKAIKSGFFRDQNTAELESIRSEYETAGKLCFQPALPVYHDLIPVTVRLNNEIEVKGFILVMDMLDAIPLDYYTRGRKYLNASEVRRVIGVLMRVLGDLHNAGLVHKDVNPGSILVSQNQKWDGIASVWIVDFGACSLPRRFTPQFAAPEQHAEPLYGPVGPWSDLYSTGLIYYLLWEGRMPFSTKKIVREVCDPEDFTFVFKRCNNPDEQSIIRRLTHKDPQKRFNNASEAMNALKRIHYRPPLSHLEKEACQAGRPYEKADS